VRTTVTLDPDVAALLERLMRERGMSFKQAINHAIRAGLAEPPDRPPMRTPTFHMGFEPAVPWDKALRLAAELEDDELARRLAARK
jgi:Ribbon-helix-helix protein, copG family